jgi:GrpB-like predicted nucleotidyltransferase (UPF0157 family)
MKIDLNINRKYTLQEYDLNWQNKFEKIKILLSYIFKEKALKIEHVGSTSIVGMKAKPLIDVLVIIKKIESFYEEKEKMIIAGYEWGEEYIGPNTLIFYKVAHDGSKTENIHVCEHGSSHEKRFLVMRAFFRAFPEKAKEYSELKEKNFNLYPNNYPAYVEAKDAFLGRIEQESYEWNKQNKIVDLSY